jgi:hypothetical protein
VDTIKVDIIKVDTTKEDITKDPTINKEGIHHSNNDMTTTNREVTISTRESREDLIAKNVLPVWVLWHAAAVFVTVFSDHMNFISINFLLILKINCENYSFEIEPE